LKNLKRKGETTKMIVHCGASISKIEYRHPDFLIFVILQTGQVPIGHG
jgi:hypothetical protein